MFFYINTKIKYFIKKMKSIILLITLLAPLIVSKILPYYATFPVYKSEEQVYNDVIKNVTAKTGYSLKLEKGKNYIEAITALPIPENVKNWVKKVDVSRKNSVANIDFSYDSKKGGKAEGELYYLTTKDNKISFYYGTASAILERVKTYNKPTCIMIIFGKKCKNNLFTPTINEETLKDKVNLKMRNAIQIDILFKNVSDILKTVTSTQKK